MNYVDTNAEDIIMLMIKNSTCRKNWMAIGTGEKKRNAFSSTGYKPYTLG